MNQLDFSSFHLLQRLAAAPMTTRGGFSRNERSMSQTPQSFPASDQRADSRFEPIAIVGLSCLFPKADSPESFWSNIKHGVDAIIEVPSTHWDPQDYFKPDPKAPDQTYARRGGFLSPVAFDPLEFGISPRNLDAIDTSQLLSLVAAKRALEHAGYGADREFDRTRVSCILGVTGTLELVIPLGARLGHPRWRKALKDAGVADDVADDVVQRISDSYVGWQENSFPGLLGNVVAGRIANKLDLLGTNCVVDAACASSLAAIHLAALELQSGRSDVVLSGGVDTFNDIFMFMCFSKTPALSMTGDSRPFSAGADGTILGEGVGIVVLKRLADAQRDGDRIFSVIRGIGSSSDGKGTAIYAPKVEGQIRCLEAAYRSAGIPPESIELLEAHGTGTKLGDQTELIALKEFFSRSGQPGKWCAIGSVKSQMGHAKAAAGIASVIKCVMSLYNRVLPPTLKVDEPAAIFAQDGVPFYPNVTARPWIRRSQSPRRAGVSAFGFGGSNFHCVLEEPPIVPNTPGWDGRIQLLAASAETPSELRAKVNAWRTVGSWRQLRELCSESRRQFSPQQQYRLVAALEQKQLHFGNTETAAAGGTPWSTWLDGLEAQLDQFADRSHWATPEGVFFGSGAANGSLGWLFPGQGSQSLQMLVDLACTFPVMREILAEANAIDSESGTLAARGCRLSDAIYPATWYDKSARDALADRLQETQTAQPAIGAVSLGALSVLEQFGLRGAAAAGHSFGELTALCAARRIDPRALYRLAAVRGQLMAESSSEAGGMLAVAAPVDVVEDWIENERLDLVIANRNSPAQLVLSGRATEIERATVTMEQRRLRGKRLAVSSAFHSPLMTSAGKRFRPALDSIDFQDGQVPVYSNLTADRYPSEGAAARDLLAAQLTSPVRFVDQIESMYRDGVRTFVEVGPGSVLTGLVGSILSGRPHKALAIDSSAGRRNGVWDLALLLGQLAADGHSLRLEAWDAPTAYRDTNQPPAADRMTVSLTGANYVSPRTSRSQRAAKLPATSPAVSAPTTSATPPVTEPTSVASLGETTIPPADVRPSVSVANEVSNQSLAAALSPVVTSEPMVVPAQLSNSAIAPTGGALELLQQLALETTRLHRQYLEQQQQILSQVRALVQSQAGTVQQAVVVPQLNVSVPLAAASQPVVAPSTVVAPITIAEPPAPTAVSVVEPQNVAAVAAPVAATTPSAPAVAAQPEPTTSFWWLDDTATAAPASSGSGASALTASSFDVPVAASPMASPVVETPAAVAAPAAPVAHVIPAPASPVEPQPFVASPATEALSALVLSVVAEKTGYPVEMLKLPMTLDHDLGIDSIKRVEILSAVQEREPSLPAIQPDQLGQLQSLADVVALLGQLSPVTAGTAPEAADGPTPSTTTPDTPAPTGDAVQSAAGTVERVAHWLLEVVAEKTGYPVNMLRLPMTLDHDLGIDSIKRVEILSALQERLPEVGAIGPDELGELRTLDDIARRLSRGIATAVTATESLVSQSAHAASAAVSQTTTAAASLAATAATTVLGAATSLPSALASAATAATVTAASVFANAIGAAVGVAPIAPVVDTGATAAGSGLSATELLNEVLAVVADKTGYPVEMLKPSMTLDHDLGIDSIKRVEILSAIQERQPALQAVQPDQLGQLQTLADIANLLSQQAPTQTPAPSPVTVATSPAPAAALPNGSVAASGLFEGAVVSCPLAAASTRSQLRLPNRGEFWITNDDSDLSLLIARELSIRGYRTRMVDPADPQRHTPAPDLAGLVLVAPRSGSGEGALWSMLHWAQATGPALRQNAKAGAAVLATVSRLDGEFGLSATGPCDAASGGLAGLLKSAAREWPEVTCKAIDLDDGPVNREVRIRQLVDELLATGPIEVGVAAQGLMSVGIQPVPVGDHRAGTACLQAGDVVVMTGGGRGVTAAAARALAAALPLRIVLLGRTPLPGAEPSWLASATTALTVKAALAARAPAGTTPRQLEEQTQVVLAGREIRETLAALTAAGAQPSYLVVDLRDPLAVHQVVTRIQQEQGPIRGLVHGAGVLADARIEAKTAEQFRRVYQTKVSGLKHLLAAVPATQLKFVGLFSSFSARFGRIGQVDYAMANEVLNKLAQQFARQQPHCRVVSWNWGPWDGGMVTGGLKQIFAAEGVELIPQAAGGQLVAAALSDRHPAVERVVLAQPLETLPGSPKPVAGSPASLPAGPAAVASPTPAVAGGHPQSPENGFVIAFEQQVSVATVPCLASHVLAGKAVFPVALMIEWLSAGACHRHPGLELLEVAELKVLRGLKLGRSDSRLVRVELGRPDRRGTEFLLDARLVAVDSAMPQTLVTAKVRLGQRASNRPEPQPDTTAANAQSGALPAIDAVYRERLFHGPAFQGLTRLTALTANEFAGLSRQAPAPAQWWTGSLRPNWLTEPLAGDVALQLPIVWATYHRGSPILPLAVASYQQFVSRWPAGEVQIVGRLVSEAGATLRFDVDLVDPQAVRSNDRLLARLTGAEFIRDPQLAAAFRQNTVQ